MDNVIDLNKIRARKELAKTYFATDADHSLDPNHDLKMLFIDSTESILSEWKQHAVDDSLNEYVISYFKDRLIDRSQKYISDLNAVSKLEKLVNLSPLILGPGATVGNSIGWGAGFYLNGLLIATPEFSCESYARCFSVLLFIRLKNGKKQFSES